VNRHENEARTCDRANRAGPIDTVETNKNEARTLILQSLAAAAAASSDSHPTGDIKNNQEKGISSRDSRAETFK